MLTYLATADPAAIPNGDRPNLSRSDSLLYPGCLLCFADFADCIWIEFWELASMNQPVNQVTNQLVNPVVNQLVNQSVHQPVHQRALITGASSGIGRATAIALAQAGMDVALVSRSREKLETVAAEVANTGVKVKTYPIDLAILDRIQPEMAAIEADFGAIDLLINNAGMGYTNRIESTSLADWQTVLNLNLTSVFQCIQAILPGMRDRKQGTVINIASIAAYQAFSEWGAYCVSKAGLVSLSKVLAQEERANGIRVMVISPGSVNTSIWDTDTVNADFDRSRMLTPEVVAQSILHAALLPPQAVIEELTLMPNAGTF